MGVLKFARSGSNRLKWTTIAATLADVGDGAWTCACLVKPVTVTGGLFYGHFYGLSGTGNGTTAAGVSIDNTSRVYVDLADHSGTNGPTMAANDISMLVTSKAAGSVAPIQSKYLKSSTTWTHTTSNDPTVADKADFTMIEIGAWQNGDFADSWIGLCAFWEGAMSQTDKESLVTNWQTSDVWTVAHGQPKFLVELNVAAGSVVDLTGNATSLSATGTTLDAGETLTSWNFNGTGAAAPEIPVLVMAPPIPA